MIMLERWLNGNLKTNSSLNQTDVIYVIYGFLRYCLLWKQLSIFFLLAEN